MNESLTRRQVLALSGSVMLGATASQSARAAARPAAGSASALYSGAFVLDANTLSSIGRLASAEDIRKKLRDIQASGITAVKTTLGGPAGSFEDTVADIGAAQALIERYPDQFIKVVRHSDLERAQRERKLAVIFSFEAATMLDGQLERIDMFRRFDVLVMQLSYNHQSAFGSGCLDDESGGVTESGRAAIEKMNALGIALDLSHANTRTTAEGIALSARPPLITHAGCDSVFAHPRNKKDREIKALADKGGVMGIYMLPYLTVDTRQPMLADYVEHMLHALNVGGEDHVGIGTDSFFFEAGQTELKQVAELEAQRKKAGVGAPGENRPPYLPDVNTPRKLERVADALLKKGYGERATEKVLGLNFRRAFKDIWLA